MPRATKQQIAATETTPEPDSTDWAPGAALKGRTYSRILVYAEDPGCAIKSKVDGAVKIYQMAVQVPDHTARHLGMKEVDSSKLPEDVTTTILGSYKAGSIKIPWMEAGKPKKTPKGKDVRVSIPVPGGATLVNIVTFLKTECTKNRPNYYITPRGVKRPISTSS